MGGSGFGYPLVPLRAKVASNAAVRTAVVKVLRDTWGYLGAWKDMAIGWISEGECSLLKIQDVEPRAPADAVHVMLTSAEWDRNLAEHWVDTAFAWARWDFEVALGRLGLGVDPASWPNVERAFTDIRFVLHEGRLGRIAHDRVEWSSANYQWRTQDVAELAPELRARFDRLAHCECPMCERFAAELWPLVRPRDGHQATRVQAWHRADALLAPRTGGVVFVGWTWMRHAWALRTPGEAAWTTVPQLSHRVRPLALLHDAGDGLVALREGAASVSLDGGATWSEPAPTGLPELKKPPRLCVHAHRPAVVHATVNAAPKKPAQLFRSDDGGRTFGAPVEPTFDGAPAATIAEVIAFPTRILAFGQRDKKGPVALATCEDGSGRFATRDLGAFDFGGAWASSSGVVAMFGHVAGESLLLRSRDEGRTWTAVGAPANVSHAVLGGRWFVIERGVGIHVSDDDGDTWACAIEGDFRALAADGADPSSVYALVAGVAMHVVVGTVAPVALPAPAFAMPEGPLAAPRPKRTKAR